MARRQANLWLIWEHPRILNSTARGSKIVWKTKTCCDRKILWKFFEASIVLKTSLGFQLASSGSLKVHIKITAKAANHFLRTCSEGVHIHWRRTIPMREGAQTAGTTRSHQALPPFRFHSTTTKIRHQQRLLHNSESKLGCTISKWWNGIFNDSSTSTYENHHQHLFTLWKKFYYIECFLYCW